MHCLNFPGAKTAPHTPFLRKSALTVATLGALGLTSPPALADSSSVTVQWFSSPPIVVEADGNDYIGVVSPDSSIEGSLLVEIDAQTSGRVKSWTAKPKLGVLASENQFDVAWATFHQSDTSVAYSVPRPKSVSELAIFSIPSQHYAPFMVVGCNFHAEVLRAQGLGNEEIFAQDRQIKVAVHGGVEYETTGVPSINPVPPETVLWSSYPQITVTCQAAEDLSPFAPDITSATLSAATQQTSNVSGACVLQLNGQLTSQEPNTQVKFRYIDDSGQQSDLRTVTTDGGGDVSFQHSYPLDLKQKTSGKVQMVGASHAFKSNWAEYQVDCEGPSDDLFGAAPPEATSLILAPEGEILHGAFVCPAQVTMIGKLEGRGAATGTASLVVEGALNAEKAYSLDHGEAFFIQGEYELDWNEAGVYQQSLPFVLYATNTSGEQVSSLARDKIFACEPVKTGGVAQGASGGVTTGAEEPLPAQAPTAGALVAQQPTAVAIMAPRGPVRSGDIRLSGGKPGAVYNLTFFRKDAGRYTAVKSLKLPKQMKGSSAAVPRAAFVGGHNWRLRVCPADGQDGKACSTSDFSLQPLGSGSGRTIAPIKREGGTLRLVPGLGN